MSGRSRRAAFKWSDAAGFPSLTGPPSSNIWIDMRSLLTLAIALCCNALAGPVHASEQIEEALIQAANLGTDAKAEYSNPSGEFVLGVVLSESLGKLLVLRRQSSGTVGLESESLAFENGFGPGYYIEIVQASGPRRFSIQVNSHSGCGIQVETFRLALAGGAWRVAGYDKAEPDSAETCNVNFHSREYSANLLTGRVHVVEYRAGHPVKRESRATKVTAPSLSSFKFSMFQNEP